MLKRLSRFLQRPDTRSNLAQALLKRVLWRLHWLIKDHPYEVTFAENLRIKIPKSGSGSLIYYQGFSEFETADFFMRFLKPDSIVIDVGAHIGEYTLLSSDLVGSSGKVYAFEAQPNTFSTLRENVTLNNLTNVTLNSVAVSDNTGEIEFEIHDEPSISSIRKPSKDTPQSQNTVVVPTITLDNYCQQHNLDNVTLIKVDVEGAEKLVFQGAEHLMTLSPEQSPTWIFEYSPSAYQSFGYSANALFDLLIHHGYQIYRYSQGGTISEFTPNSPARGIINLVATKDPSSLRSMLNNEPKKSLMYAYS